MKKTRTLSTVAVLGVALVSGVVAWQGGPLREAPPEIPAQPAAIPVVVTEAYPFTLAEPTTHYYRSEQPSFDRGTLLVLQTDPEMLIRRQTAEAVLYVGAETATRVNNGDESGYLVAYVPGEVDLSTAPVYFGEPALPEQADGQVAEIIGFAGRQFEGLPECRFGLLDQAQVVQGVAQAVQGGRGLRVQPDRLAAHGKSFLQPPGVPQHDTQVVEVSQVVRCLRDGTGDQFRGLCRPAACVADQPELVQGLRVPGLLLQHPAAQLFTAPGIARLQGIAGGFNQGKTIHARYPNLLRSRTNWVNILVLPFPY